MSKQNSLKSSLKSFSTLSLAQLANILTGIIRTKFVAIFLGPEGVGIIGILQTTIELLFSLSNCGISTSSVREIASCSSIEQKKKVVTVFKYLSFLTAIVGALILLLFSESFSLVTFGNLNYSLTYMILSMYVIFRSLNSYHLAFMQANQYIRLYAKTNALGSFLSLFFVIPIIYWGGVAGIPFLLIASMLSMVIASSYFYNRIDFKANSTISKNEIKKISLNLLKLGISLTISGSVLSVLIALIIRTYINNFGTIEDVGFYQAGWAILNSYIGVFFVVMSTDYYPKLSNSINEFDTFNVIYNQQIQLTMLVLGPVLIGLLMFLHLVVIMLYTGDFLVVESFVRFSLLGVFFKAIAYAISYVFLARAAIHTYFYTEILSDIVIVLANIVGYQYGGIVGMGIAFTISYIISFLLILLFSRKAANAVAMSKKTISVIIVVIGSFILSLIIDLSCIGIFKYILVLTIFILLSIYALRQLSYDFNLISHIKSKILK